MRVRCAFQATPRRSEKARFQEFVSTTRHTHSPHTRDATRRDARDIRMQRSARISVSLSISPLVLRSSFEFPLSPRLSPRRVLRDSYLILTTTSLLLATTSASRAFPSSLLADPTSTQDLFTNPSRSTIPVDWLAARRVSREHVGATRAVVAVVFGPNERLSLARSENVHGVRERIAR